MPKRKQTVIFLTGGGTAGSVTPLLALAEELGTKQYAFRWIGTNRGPERAMAADAGIAFATIAAGKFRRYFSLRNVIDPLFVVVGFLQSLWLIARHRPRWIVSAGGFVSVPVVWAGWLVRRSTLIHQQDVRPGLANRLMAPFATVITTAFDVSKAAYGKKAQVVGNPVRKDLQTLPSAAVAKTKLGLNGSKPVILIFGGGTGAAFVNRLVAQSAPELSAIAQILHLCGTGKGCTMNVANANYHSFEFFNAEQMAQAYAAADIVVARAGLSTITELSFLKKPAIIIPMPYSHQVDNARFLETHNAARVLDEPVLEQEFFIQNVRELLQNKRQQREFGECIHAIMPHDAARSIAAIIDKQRSV